MNTLTQIHPLRGAGWREALTRALSTWRHRAPAPSARIVAEELRARAADYQRTQPSFAADLRAAAESVIDLR